MSVILGSTGITFPDATTQTTAASGGVTSLNGQTGAITNTSLYAIGSYVTGRPQNGTTYSVDTTIAGSSLYSASGGISWSTGGSNWNIPGQGSTTTGFTLINTGTWRCVSPTGQSGVLNSVGLWVRIS